MRSRFQGIGVANKSPEGQVVWFFAAVKNGELSGSSCGLRELPRNT